MNHGSDNRCSACAQQSARENTLAYNLAMLTRHVTRTYVTERLVLQQLQKVQALRIPVAARGWRQLQQAQAARGAHLLHAYLMKRAYSLDRQYCRYSK